MRIHGSSYQTFWFFKKILFSHPNHFGFYSDDRRDLQAKVSATKWWKAMILRGFRSRKNPSGAEELSSSTFSACWELVWQVTVPYGTQGVPCGTTYVPCDTTGHQNSKIFRTRLWLCRALRDEYRAVLLTELTLIISIREFFRAFPFIIGD